MIFLIRHGQTTTNAQNLLVGRSDPSLTDLGRRQAESLSAHLVGVDELWVSPLERARLTGELALPHLKPLIKPSFIEVDYGSLDGQSVGVISEEMWRNFESNHDVAFGGGESLAQVDERVHAELDELLHDRTSALHNQERHLAIVTHVSPIKSAVTWALGVSPSVAWRTRVDNASLTILGVRHSSPILVRFNEVPHSPVSH